ncbi:hypothetical protein PM082_000192 [Marasmius tenuissimus]|nr:hypothetical protein PM082_000192 [Marasmius tenuissimus]
MAFLKMDAQTSEEISSHQLTNPLRPSPFATNFDFAHPFTPNFLVPSFLTAYHTYSLNSQRMNFPFPTTHHEMNSPHSKKTPVSVSPPRRSSPMSPQKQKKIPPPITLAKGMSPAEAIAEAWKRESEESKQRWMRLHADMKQRYSEPRTSSRDRRNKL